MFVLCNYLSVFPVSLSALAANKHEEMFQGDTAKQCDITTIYACTLHTKQTVHTGIREWICHESDRCGRPA